MDQAAPQAADCTAGDGTRQALDALRAVWGDGYMFGHDPEHGWWVIKDGRIGSVLTANSPEELSQMLTDAEVAGEAGGRS